MRTHGFRHFAVLGMLALLFGGQWCMLVTCAPKSSQPAAHACCAKSAAAPRSAQGAPTPHECARPCCMQAATTSAPALEKPAVLDTHAFAAILAVAREATAPRLSHAPSPPGDVLAPSLAPPHPAAGSRAPPLA